LRGLCRYGSYVQSHDVSTPPLPLFIFIGAYSMENLQPTVGPDGKVKEPESNVLLASIENMQYSVTVDVLHTVRMRIIQYLLFISNKELT
jgi:hypothetical protein